MYRELERAIGELRVNHTDKEITRVFYQYSRIVKGVSEGYTGSATVEDIRADHPEYGFLDDRQIKGILEQAEKMRGTREPDKEYLTVEDLMELLNRNKGWGNEGTKDQRAWIETAAMSGTGIEELAGMVWVCTAYGSIAYIEETMREYLKEKREKRCSGAESTSGYDVGFIERCVDTHMGAFCDWPYGDVKKIEVDRDGNLRIHYTGGMYWRYKEKDGGIIWW